MARLHATSVTGGVLIVLALGSASAVRAQLGIGTWVKQASGPAGGGLTMTVEPCCNGGVRLVYRLVGQADGKTLTVEDEFTTPAGGQTVGKQTETWLRK